MMVGVRSFIRAQRAWVCVMAVACGPAVADDATTAVDSNADTDDDPGERPSDPGAMYSACAAVSECAPLEFCVFPTREGGYCSAACGGGEDASVCAAAPGDGAEIACLDIGVPDGRQVCALDCSDGGCPEGMRCEGIETPAGARRICF
jgi:hypothetical protein